MPRPVPQHISYAIGESGLGFILAAASPQGLVVIALGDDAEMLAAHAGRQFPDAGPSSDDPFLQQALNALISYVDAPATVLDLSLDVRGTVFQHQVWAALRQIPAGVTCSYGELAKRIGAPKAYRAVAAACAANPLALAIPCHRVISANGGLSGYRWGVERKAALLRREREAVTAGVAGIQANT